MRRRQVFRAQASKTQTGSSARRFVSSGPVLPFNPASIPGCQLWLDAADTSTVALNGSTNVSLWIDKSGNGNTVTQDTSANQPTYVTNVVNGNPVIRFNGTSHVLQTTSFTSLGTNSVSFWLVERNLSNSGGGGAPFSFNSGPNGGIVFQNNNGLQPLPNSVPYTSSVARIVFYNRTNTGSGDSTYLNGGVVTTRDDNTTGTYGTTFAVGMRIPSTIYTSGDICEILIFIGMPTTSQRQKVEGYLAWKWGIQSSLPSNHPYKGIAPTYEVPVFIPTLISGSRIWLDASDQSSITLSGSSVTQIVDKSSNGYVFTGSTGTYPSRTATLNGIPVISSSSGKYLQNTNFNQNFTTATFFAVIRPTQDITPNGISGGYAAYLIIYGTSLGGFAFVVTYANQAQTGDPSKFFIEIDKQGTGFINGALGGASPSTYNPVNTPLNIGAVMTGSSTTNSAYLNGTSVNLTYNNPGTFPSISGLGVRCFAGFGCDYAEILMYGSVLTSVERQRIEGYLAHKWGVQSSLSANHPYKTIAPTGIPRSMTIQSLSAIFSPSSKALSIPSKSSFTLGINNHTIEFWFYQTNRTNYDITFSYGDLPPVWTGTSTYIFQAGNPHSTCILGNGAGGWAVELFKGGNSYALNTWHHFAIVRNGTTFTLYIDGTSHSTATSSVNIGPSFGSMVIGSLTSTGHVDGFTGYISNFRFVNGTAVYTSNFTPPTSPLTAIPNTQVLIQGLVDKSPNAYAVTNNGNVALSTFSPFV